MEGRGGPGSVSGRVVVGWAVVVGGTALYCSCTCMLGSSQIRLAVCLRGEKYGGVEVKAILGL